MFTLNERKRKRSQGQDDILNEVLKYVDQCLAHHLLFLNRKSFTNIENLTNSEPTLFCYRIKNFYVPIELTKKPIDYHRPLYMCFIQLLKVLDHFSWKTSWVTTVKKGGEPYMKI